MNDEWESEVCGNCILAKPDGNLPDHLRVCRGGYSGYKRLDQRACRVFESIAAVKVSRGYCSVGLGGDE